MRSADGKADLRSAGHLARRFNALPDHLSLRLEAVAVIGNLAHGKPHVLRVLHRVGNILPRKGRDGHRRGSRAVINGHGLPLSQRLVLCRHGADNSVGGVLVGAFLLALKLQIQAQIGQQHPRLSVFHTHKVLHQHLLGSLRHIDLNEQVALTGASRRGILLNDLSRLVVGGYPRTQHFDLEDILDALQLLRLLHGHADDARHGVALVARSRSEAAKNQLEQQHHQQHRRRENADDDGSGLPVSLRHLVLVVIAVILCFVALLRRVLFHGGDHLRRGNGHGGFGVGRRDQLLTDILHIHRGVAAEFFQVLNHGIRRSVPLVRVAVHRLHADQLQRLGDGGVDVPRNQRHGAQMLYRHGDGTVALKGQPPREHFVQHHAGGVDVRAGINAVASRLLGGNVVYRAQGLLRQRLSRVGKTRDAKVGDLHAAVTQHHDVLRLDVAVDDAAAVGVAQSAHDLRDEVQRFAPVHAAAPLHVLLERDAVDQLHDDVLKVGVGGDIVDRDDIRVAELRDRL